MTKTKYMVFSRCNTFSGSLQLKIDNHEIERVDRFILLGITLQNDLKWKDHINYITLKLSKINSILFLIRSKLNLATLKLIYYSLVQSYLTYCNVIWGSTYKTHLKPLITTHKNIVRTMTYSIK